MDVRDSTNPVVVSASRRLAVINARHPGRGGTGGVGHPHACAEWAETDEGETAFYQVKKEPGAQSGRARMSWAEGEAMSPFGLSAMGGWSPPRRGGGDHLIGCGGISR